MSIPLCSNVAITKITQSLVDSNSSILNDMAGTAKSLLPVQYFQLDENITGNLTLNNNTAHKKIILDTNGKTILNPNGSPLTQNSSTALEVKGSGNVQSTLKTSTLAQTDATHTGTTNFANSDSSTIAVSNVGTDLTVEKYKDFTRTSNSQGSANISYTGSDIDSGVTTIGGSTPNASTIFSDTSVSSGNTFNTNGGTPVFIGDTATSSSSPASYNYQLYIATVANTTIGLRMDEYANIGSGTSYSGMGFGGLGGNHNSAGGNKHQIGFYSMWTVGPTQEEGGVGGLTFTRRFWFRFIRSGNDRSFVFTNNLNIACVLSGSDPFDGVTVNSGATATSTASNSTDGTYNITMTISGNDGNSHPYALAKLNNGTGTVDLTTQGYTGVRSSDGAID